MVGPPASSAPRWAAASMPRAAPLTTHDAARRRSRAESPAISCPTASNASADHRRRGLGQRCEGASPRTNTPTGGSVADRAARASIRSSPGDDESRAHLATESADHTGIGLPRNARSPSRACARRCGRRSRHPDAEPRSRPAGASLRGRDPEQARQHQQGLDVRPGLRRRHSGKPDGTGTSAVSGRRITRHGRAPPPRTPSRYDRASTMCPPSTARRILEIRDRARHLQGAVEPSARERERSTAGASDASASPASAHLAARDRARQVRVARDAERGHRWRCRSRARLHPIADRRPRLARRTRRAARPS